MVRTSLGDSPDGLLTARPVARRRLSPATLTMKNSSRFEEKMLRKFTRSRRCMVGSWASSKTLRLNASQLSSLSKKRSADNPSRDAGRVIAMVSSDIGSILTRQGVLAVNFY